MFDGNLFTTSPYNIYETSVWRLGFCRLAAAGAMSDPPVASPSSKNLSPLFFLTPPTPPEAPTYSPILPPSFRGEPSLKIPQSVTCRWSLKAFSLFADRKIFPWQTVDRAVKAVFAKLGLNGNFSFGHLDPKHILIQLDHEGGFNLIWLKDLWLLDGYPMRVFRWTPDFHANVESPIVPVIWNSLPNLSIFLYRKSILFSIARMIGNPLTLDIVAAEFTRLIVARICVEVDLLKRLPNRVRLECGDSIPAFWQEVQYENLPSYCKHCRRHLGHSISACKVANPPTTQIQEVKAKNPAPPSLYIRRKPPSDKQRKKKIRQIALPLNLRQ